MFKKNKRKNEQNIAQDEIVILMLKTIECKELLNVILEV